MSDFRFRTVKRKIEDLRKLEKALADMVSECKGADIPDCPIVGTLSAMPDAERRL